MKILGIETSCDDTGVALYDSENGLLAHALHSQTDIHVEYGGVVPELASRDHIRKLAPLVAHVCDEANLAYTALDGIAYTRGPGLIGALLVGSGFARGMAASLGIPSLGVHHIEAHLLAAFLEDNAPEFPFLSLIVSGGHSLLVAVNGLGDYEILGETLDDAAGEAFDKTAKLLGLPYPGGPQIGKLAEQGDPGRYTFPRPMVNRPGLDFSFSGLKTYALNTWQASAQDDQVRADITYAFQEAIVDTLTIKVKRALDATNMQRLVIAGGVGANLALRHALEQLMQQRQGRVYYPRIAFCTDNGAMVAYTGCQRFLRGERSDNDINVKARWPLTDLTGF